MDSRRKTTPTATDRIRDGVHKRVDAMADSFDSVRDSANRYVEEGRERANELAGTFEDAVRERPITSILIGAAVGFVVGCFIFRR
jgi:ElaB/YqjD/DUF883 family membrane-anchored ribosome-binding protein